MGLVATSAALLSGCHRGRPPQCGVASLVNVLARAAHPVPYRDLLTRTRVEQGHATFADLARAAKSMGVAMRGYRLTEPRALAAGDLGIVELTADHLIALVGRRGDEFQIVDSSDGERHGPASWSAARLESEWTGNVLLVERRQVDEKTPRSSSP